MVELIKVEKVFNIKKKKLLEGKLEKKSHYILIYQGCFLIFILHLNTVHLTYITTKR